MITEQQIRVHRQHIRQQYVRISVMDKTNNIIGQLEGRSVDGEIDIDSTQSIQRTCSNLKILLNKSLLPGQYSLIWTNKKFRLETGIKDILTDEIIYFNQGIYLYNTIESNYSSTDNTLTINGLDLMCNFTGQINGQFKTAIKIANQGIPISEAIRHIVVDLGGETNVLIDDIVDDKENKCLLPYTLTADAGDNMYDTIKKLVDMYKYYIFYYDVDGNFVLEHKKMLLDSDIDIDLKGMNWTISDQQSQDFTYIKNYVKVLGVSLEPTVTVIDSPSVNNPNPVNNSSMIKILFNKPVYDKEANRLTDGQDVKDYFEFNGNVDNYTKAIYDDSDWSVIFTITGENGKILKPNTEMIYDSAQMPFDDGGIIFSSKDQYWSKLLDAIVVTDGINNTTQFTLSFNKPLYDKDGNQLNNDTDVKDSFVYSNGDADNFLSAIYTYDTYMWEIKLSFKQAIQDAVIQINKDGENNEHSLYDSAGIIYQPISYIMNGTTWTKVLDTPLPSYQIWSEISNTDNNSPYSIDNIGEERVLIVNDSQNIFNTSQAELRAKYELELHSNLNETLNLSMLPLHYMDVNKVVYLYRPELNIDDKYKVDKVNLPLKEDGTMSVNLSKIYM